MGTSALRTFLAAGLLVAVSSLTGCSPELRSTIAVPDVPSAGHMFVGSISPGTAVTIDRVKDLRSVHTLVTMGTERSEPIGDVGESVRRAMEDSFRDAGFTISESAPMLISTEIVKWSAHVTSGFPSETSSEAEIRVKVYDPANHLVHTGHYSGAATNKDASLGEDKIRANLAEVMSEVVGQVLQDRRLMKLISAF